MWYIILEQHPRIDIYYKKLDECIIYNLQLNDENLSKHFTAKHNIGTEV